MNRREIAMRHVATRELFEYWNSLRGGRAAPERADINLAAIAGLIADMFMLGIDAAHRFPFVLSGTRVNALACAELNGRSFVDLWSPLQRRAVAATLLTVMDAACPVLAAAVAKPEGWPDHEFEILLLPLRGRDRSRARLLGLVAASAAASWLGLMPVKALNLRCARPIGEASGAFALDPAETFSAPSGSTALPRAGKASRTVRHLRVFQGGRHIS